MLVDTWIPFLEALVRKTSGLAFYELPTIGSGIPFFDLLWIQECMQVFQIRALAKEQ